MPCCPYQTMTGMKNTPFNSCFFFNIAEVVHELELNHRAQPAATEFPTHQYGVLRRSSKWTAPTLISDNCNPYGVQPLLANAHKAISRGRQAYFCRALGVGNPPLRERGHWPRRGRAYLVQGKGKRRTGGQADKEGRWGGD